MDPMRNPTNIRLDLMKHLESSEISTRFNFNLANIRDIASALLTDLKFGKKQYALLTDLKFGKKQYAHSH